MLVVILWMRVVRLLRRCVMVDFLSGLRGDVEGLEVGCDVRVVLGYAYKRIEIDPLSSSRGISNPIMSRVVMVVALLVPSSST